MTETAMIMIDTFGSSKFCAATTYAADKKDQPDLRTLIYRNKKKYQQYKKRYQQKIRHKQRFFKRCDDLRQIKRKTHGKHYCYDKNHDGEVGSVNNSVSIG